jgi:uncharacterized membrane protein (UPF0127 family)
MAAVSAVLNSTTGQTIAARAGVADSFLGRLRGLMLRRSLPEGEGLVLRPCGSIHMMFMFMSIDAIFFDRDLRVTRVARHVRPWIGIAFGGRGAKGVIELPVGAARGVEPGHQLVLQPQ